MSCLRDDEFLHGDRHGRRLKFGQNHFACVIGKFFDQLPTPAFAEFHEVLAYLKVIDRFGDSICGDRRTEVVNHVHCHEDALRLGAFFIGYADMDMKFEVNDGDFRHGQRIYSEVEAMREREL